MYNLKQMNQFPIDEIITRLRKACKLWPQPSVSVIAHQDRSPFKVLVSCIISLRTRDEVTAAVSKRLFSFADTPGQLAAMTAEEVSKLIYPAGFYRTKASQLVEIAQVISEQHHGELPDDLDQLLKFKGVGRKTANLVLTLGFGKPGICVDTHVHRIANRWGYLSTVSADATEMALRKVLPAEYWIEINDLLVAFGQNCCTPISPKCSTCKLQDLCEKQKVLVHR
jgi:endonuclease III